MEKRNAWLQAALDYQFNDERHLVRALTHRSVPGGNNERLEFLGDAVLDTVISEVVFRACPAAPEGDLSRLRSALVKDSTLAEIAAGIGIGDWIILGPGEKKTGGHRRGSILADALEALFGAVYLDAGYEQATQVIYRVYGERLDDLPDPVDLTDPKTRLQEFLQARKLPLPDYSISNVTGKAHRQNFSVQCRLSNPELVTEGAGGSRRDAEQAAADEMIKLVSGAVA